VWNKPDKRIILASQSPRRRDILSLMGLSFECISPSISDEMSYLRDGNLSDALQTLALAKAESIAATFPGALVLGADTVVVSGEKILGKPKDAADAREMLEVLSGRVHTVFTGVALTCPDDSFTSTRCAATAVSFRTLAKGEIDEYLSCGEWHDKAGAYAIQGKALVFIDKIDGCYYNVVGLPVSATIDCLTDYQLRKDAQA
jgi:septum formation protein